MWSLCEDFWDADDVITCGDPLRPSEGAGSLIYHLSGPPPDGGAGVGVDSQQIGGRRKRLVMWHDNHSTLGVMEHDGGGCLPLEAVWMGGRNSLYSDTPSALWRRRHGGQE